MNEDEHFIQNFHAADKGFPRNAVICRMQGMKGRIRPILVLMIFWWFLFSSLFGTRPLYGVGENYRFESGSEQQTSLLTRGKRNATSLQTINGARKRLNANKRKDVNNLLTKQFGEKWFEQPELIFYKKIIVDEDDLNTEPELEDHAIDNECQCLEDDIGDVRVW